jgi:hypothetical protein
VAGVSLIADGPPPAAAVETSQGVTAEIVAVIEAAAAQFMGKPVRILSIRIINELNDDSNVWASQGRDIIQTSHNLVQRGH